MTKQQKEQIIRMRIGGFSYSQITLVLRLSENTVKSFCRRNNLGGIKGLASQSVDVAGIYCRQCGRLLTRTPKAKQKRFCSDKCRMTWWNAHPEAVNHKSVREFACQTCGKVFIGYGGRERKFCSRACYGRSKAVSL